MQTQNKSLLNAAPPERFLAQWPDASAQDSLRDLIGEDATDLQGASAQDTGLLQLLGTHRAFAATVATCTAHAPFLRELIRKHHTFLARVASHNPNSVIADVLQPLKAPMENQLSLRQTLRHARQKLMLYLAVGDCARTIPLQTLTRALSDLADLSLEAALRYELSQLSQKGDLQPDKAAPETCGLAILGLGKLGGRELNYSSDIDLMIYYTPEFFSYTGRKDKSAAAIQLARAVCGHLSAKTADGFVFRVDLRLRPDPASTPIAMTLNAAETYYQSAGLTWERAALIKARHSAGDQRISEDFLERIRPFVWRRHLDFAAIDDVHAMRQRVHDHHNQDQTDEPGSGFDVKLGHGGIRDIEFFAQIHQLITGGRRPDLQLRATCDVLEVLSKDGDIAQSDCDTFMSAYRHLRSAEHRLQMLADTQTHTLPHQPETALHHAHLSGFASPQELYTDLKRHTDAVKRLFSELLTPADETKLTIPADFSDAQKLAGVLARWRGKTYRALKTQRSLDLLESVLPDILQAFANTPDPDETLLAFDVFISQIPTSVQLFSLLNANRPIITLLASVMGQSPELRNQITHKPSLFDGLFSGYLDEMLPSQTSLRSDLENLLERAQTYETVLDMVRIWNNERRFRTGVQLLKGVISPTQAANGYSDIADVCIAALYSHVVQMFQQSHGEIASSGFIVVALGSFGARELVTGSDLDLTFIYDVPGDAAHSDGPKPLPVRDYYTRLSQRFISAITSMTSEGRLYEVDMRLRPSGRSGIIAVSLEAFEDYHKNKAWLWERMSLTKARPVAGHGSLQAQFRKRRQAILNQNIDPKDVRGALWDMRERLHQASTASSCNIWALKGGDGGLTDADFLVEALVLENGQSLPQMDGLVTWQEWWEHLHKQAVIQSPMTEQIAQARQVLLHARIAKRLLVAQKADMTTAPHSARSTLAQVMDMSDFQQAHEAVQKARKTIFDSLKTLLPREDEPHVS